MKNEENNWMNKYENLLALWARWGDSMVFFNTKSSLTDRKPREEKWTFDFD